MITNDEIKLNRLIHEKVLGMCWHERERGSTNCGKCGKPYIMPHSLGTANPEYTSDSSPRSLLNRARDKAIAEKGRALFANTLCTEVKQTFTPEEWNGLTTSETVCVIATAPALTIARCIASLYGYEGGGE